MAKPRRTKNKDNARRSKKKVSLLTQEKIEYVDYKDVNLLRRFMSDRGKIRARRVTGNDAQQQRAIGRLVAGRVAKQLEKELLGDVLGDVAVPKNPVGVPVGSPLISQEQLLEGDHVSGRHPGHEGFTGSRHRLLHN